MDDILVDFIILQLKSGVCIVSTNVGSFFGRGERWIEYTSIATFILNIRPEYSSMAFNSSTIHFSFAMQTQKKSVQNPQHVKALASVNARADNAHHFRRNALSYLPLTKLWETFAENRGLGFPSRFLLFIHY